MAVILPCSERTADRLRIGPHPGETHLWLAQVAGGLREVLSPDRLAAFLRRCCEECVSHRRVPDREIAEAVSFGAGAEARGPNYGFGAVQWPEADAALIARVVAEVPPAFDVDRPPGLRPADVLPGLFRPGELVCAGAASDRAMVRPVEEVVTDAHLLQFVVVNPMRALVGTNQRGEPSARCQNNVACRRHIVAEFDDARLGKTEQARLVGALAGLAPLVLAVDSGGKSVHAWFRVDGMGAQDQARFFAAACALGADRTRWDVCGWLRMPGGLRVVDGVPRVRQRVLYWAGSGA